MALISALSLVYAPAASASSAKPAKLSISPTSHNFGLAVVGSNSSSQSFAITNTGESTSGPLAASVVGTDPADFAIDADTCTGGTLAAGAACSVSVHFDPTTVGTRKATLSVTGTPGGTVTLTVQGTGAAAQLALSPTSHGYGSVAVGTDSPAQTYTLTNTGAGPSGPVTVALAGANPSVFSETSNTCGSVLPAGSSCAVSIVYIPTAIESDTATLTASGTPGGTVSATLTGTGAAKAILSISPASFDFGSVIEGTNSADQTFTVTNTGEGKSGTVTVGFGGTDPADFTQDATTCGPKLVVGASCTVSVHFDPSAAEADDATLSVTADPGGTATATVQGTGTSPATLSIDPAAFDFGSVVLGSSSGEQTFTVTNSGQGDSGTVGVSVSGANQADFVVDSTTCGPALPGGGTCTISAHYTPSASGPGSADLAVTSTPGGTASSTLQGTGLTAAALSISPSAFDFGQTAAGASSGDQTFTVTNTGGAASGAVGVALTGSNAAAFTIDTDTCGAALPGGATCSISVHFTAGSPGTNTAGLAATASPGGTATAALQGEALAPATLSINPQFYDYGLTTLGSSDAVETFTVTNTGQSASGTPAPEVSGPDSYYFELIGNTCTSGLAAGASCTLTLAFDPFEPGDFLDYFQVSASPGGSAFAEVEGEAISAAYLYTSSPAPFSNVLIGSSSADQTITVTNEGQQTSGVVSAVIGGTDASDFTIDANTCTSALYDGQSCTVRFHFNPSAVGIRSGTLTISGSPGGSQTLNLTGTGVNELMINPTSYAFPNQPADTTSTAATFTLTNYGTTPLTNFGLTASDTTDFPITADTCVNASVAPSSTCKISVAFNADVLGQHSSSMTASLTDGSAAVQSVTFQVTGDSVVGPPDLATSMTVQSAGYSNATVQITVSNMGSAASVAATMTITVSPVQDFSYEAGAGSDCTASVINTYDSQFICPVPVIPGAGTYTRTLTIENLTSQAPMYVQNTATTIMPGDTNSSNNTGYSFVTFD